MRKVASNKQLIPYITSLKLYLKLISIPDIFTTQIQLHITKYKLFGA